MDIAERITSGKRRKREETPTKIFIESITPVKGKKGKFTTGKNGDQSRKERITSGKRRKREENPTKKFTESITPVKGKKRKLTTGKNGDQSRKGQKKQVKTGRTRQKPKKNVVEQLKGNTASKKEKQTPKYDVEKKSKRRQRDTERYITKVKPDIKLGERDQSVSKQNLTTENAAEGKVLDKVLKIGDDLDCAGNLKLALNAKNYKAAQNCATSIIRYFKQYMDKIKKSSVYTAWLGYVPCENGDITFKNIRIVSLTNTYCTVPLARFLDIPIRWRQFQEVSSEAEKTTYLEDIDVNIKYSEENEVDSGELFRKHSNLTMVHMSSFKSKGFGTNKHKIVKQPCIALYCRVKGVIPLGENPFPTSWGELPTDVREGYCTLGAGDTLHPGVYIQCIDANKSGTVGGFVENEAGKKWFITAAHIFANITQLQEDDATKEERFRSGNIIVHKNQQRIGKVVCGSFSYADDTTKTSIDAAVVEIDGTGLSVSYNFPETDDATLSGTGYSSNKLPTVRSNTLLSKTEIKENRRLQVMKYGASTKLTTGSIAIDKLDVVFHDLDMDVVDVRPDTGVKTKQKFRFCGQMGVRSCSEKSFFKTGDSGAFCFMLDQDDELSVRSFGLAIGRMSSGTCIVTPLDEVFRKLNLNDEMILSSMHPPTLPDQKKETEGLKRMLEQLLDQKFEQADRKNTQKFEQADRKNTQKFEQADRKSTQKFEQADRKSDQKFEGVYKSLSAIKEDVEQLKKKVSMDIL